MCVCVGVKIQEKIIFCFKKIPHLLNETSVSGFQVNAKIHFSQ